jgi:hypothetical protein
MGEGQLTLIFLVRIRAKGIRVIISFIGGAVTGGVAFDSITRLSQQLAPNSAPGQWFIHFLSFTIATAGIFWVLHYLTGRGNSDSME